MKMPPFGMHHPKPRNDYGLNSRQRAKRLSPPPDGKPFSDKDLEGEDYFNNEHPLFEDGN